VRAVHGAAVHGAAVAGRRWLGGGGWAAVLGRRLADACVRRRIGAGWGVVAALAGQSPAVAEAAEAREDRRAAYPEQQAILEPGRTAAAGLRDAGKLGRRRNRGGRRGR
jgi:hypothetical protein